MSPFLASLFYCFVLRFYYLRIKISEQTFNFVAKSQIQTFTHMKWLSCSVNALTMVINAVIARSVSACEETDKVPNSAKNANALQFNKLRAISFALLNWRRKVLSKSRR